MNVAWQEFSTSPENDRLDNDKTETRATADVRKLKSPLDWGLCSMERVWPKSTKYNLPPDWGSSRLCSFTWDRSPSSEDLDEGQPFPLTSISVFRRLVLKGSHFCALVSKFTNGMNTRNIQPPHLTFYSTLQVAKPFNLPLVI